jgi:hypothetical protein
VRSFGWDLKFDSPREMLTMTSIRRFGWTALALFALVGCNSEAPTPPLPPLTTPPEKATGTPTAPEPKDPKKEGASATKLTDEEIAEIKKLPAEDQKIALAQMTCPVSGEHLGESGMGAPIKQVIGDKTFFICCAGCEKTVKNNPEQVLAKLNK